MKRTPNILLFVFLAFLMSNCTTQKTKNNTVAEAIINRLPKVLYITTGADYKKEDIDLPKGIIVAVQSFNKMGIPVRLEPRDVLFDKKFLEKYNIIILSTAQGYHDADRKYSLTYMTDSELKNLNDFVAQGGIIIAGDNVGRNHYDGTDRLEIAKKLNKNNYPLTNAFGVVLEEKNMKGYGIKGNITDSLNGGFLSPSDEDLWVLVPSEIISRSVKPLAFWANNVDSIPAIIQNDYGDGTAFLLASSDFLDIGTNNDYWNISQLETFYHYVVDGFYKKNNIHLSLNPWPNAKSNAFCVTFNSQGKLKHYQNIIEGLKKYKIKPTFFVNGLLNDTIVDYIKSSDVDLASTGFHFNNYEQYNYPAAVNDLLRNENKWKYKFKGFRFPYTNPVFTGLLAIDIHKYNYESGISVNNLEFLHGSVFPYNIIITHDQFYKSTDVLEIAPTYHDDYFFLKELADNKNINTFNLQKQISLYSQYLNDFWIYSAKPYNGLMVYLGHPDLTGFDKNTFSALTHLIDTIENDDTWITTINKIAEFKKNFNNMSFYVSDSNDKTDILVRAGTKEKIKGFTINTPKKPAKATVDKGKVTIIKKAGFYSVVFDAFDGQKVSIWY